MQNVQRYYGFRVDIADALQPLKGAKRADIIARLQEQSYEYNSEEYLIYVHRLGIHPIASYRGISGFSARISNMQLTFRVNDKQKRSKKLFFCHTALPPLNEGDVRCFPSKEEIIYDISGTYFNFRTQFETDIITFVSRELRDDHQKVKLHVGVTPTDQFRTKVSSVDGKRSAFDLHYRRNYSLVRDPRTNQLTLWDGA
jgi:hypothetical protein